MREITPAGGDGVQQNRHRRLTLALEDAVDRAGAVGEDLFRYKRNAVTASKDEHVRQELFRSLRQLHDLRDVR